MIKKITYLTYQNFPANTANSIQTLKTFKYLSRYKFESKLIFPLREKSSSDNIETLQKHYGFNDNLNIVGKKHLLPFGKIRFFEKILFHFSHSVWAYFQTKKHVKKSVEGEFFYTRSIWILFFLTLRNQITIYECHKFSKITNLIFKILRNNDNPIYIFQNEILKSKPKLSKIQISRSLVIGSAFDDEWFNESLHKKEDNKIVFIGNLLRFGNSRNIEKIIKLFCKKELMNLSLHIVGGPDESAKKLKKLVDELNIENVYIHGPLRNTYAIKEMRNASIGLLMNSKDNNSIDESSPLKYYEYLASGLKVLASDIPSHKNLPLTKNITFFNEDDSEDFINKILKTRDKKFIEEDMTNYTYRYRVSSILEFAARLEGLEPPTL